MQALDRFARTFLVRSNILVKTPMRTFLVQSNILIGLLLTSACFDFAIYDTMYPPPHILHIGLMKPIIGYHRVKLSRLSSILQPVVINNWLNLIGLRCVWFYRGFSR